MEDQAKDVVPSGAQASQDGSEIVADVVLGVVAKTLSTLVWVSSPVRTLARPMARLALRPPLVPSQFQPASLVGRVARRGAASRGEVHVEVEDVLDRLVPAIVSELLHHVDLTELVRENVDVVTLAEEVIAEIDLPAIIRDSTGAMRSDTLVGVRMQSVSGDEAIGRAMDRLRQRLGRRTTPAAGPGRTTP